MKVRILIYLAVIVLIFAFQYVTNAVIDFGHATSYILYLAIGIFVFDVMMRGIKSIKGKYGVK